MTVRVNKDAFNAREKLTELDREFGSKGSELVAAETVQEARHLVSAGRKNLVINGDMRISQRYGFNNPQTVTNANNYFLDSFLVRNNTSGTFTARQSAPGTPFYNALQLNVTGADTSISSTEYARIQYHLEGNDARALDWGYAGATDHLTLSFWVKTNAPGIYNVSIENTSNFYFPLMVRKYVIEKANVWQKVVVTFPPPAGSYTFERGNNIGLKFTWSLAIGSTYSGATDGVYRPSGYQMATTEGQRNWLDTVGNDFYLTGVQAELGKNATEFEHRSIAEELALCQRYFYKIGGTQNKIIGPAFSPATTEVTLMVSHPVTMRTSPTSVTVVGTNNNNTDFFFRTINNTGVALTGNGRDGTQYSTEYMLNIWFNGMTGMPQVPGLLRVQSGRTAHIHVSAEL